MKYKKSLEDLYEIYEGVNVCMNQLCSVYLAPVLAAFGRFFLNGLGAELIYHRHSNKPD